MGSSDLGSSTSASSSMQHAYATDRPIVTEQEDRFGRTPFANRIAETIVRLDDPSSLVIGIYGAWGEGKTSVLNLMAARMRGEAGVILLRFNPWLFDSSQALLTGFFNALAVALERSLPTFREKMGEVFRKYGGLFSGVIIPIPDGAGTSIDPGAAAKALGEAMASSDPAEMRVRIEAFLREEKRRIVVMIDDIDRMDRVEVQSLFKLIKLSADFPYTAYVLAFDDEMVSAALGERYGAGNAEAGRSFLEKIVQVPLHLPPPDQTALNDMAFDGVNAALAAASLELNERQVQAFGRHFFDGIEACLKTPRQARRYGNALTFALPILKGEVHPVDQLLIEGLRVFYPALFTIVRDNPDLMIKAPQRGGWPDDDLKQRAQEAIARGLEGLLPSEQDAGKALLRALFPRVRSLYDNVGFCSDLDERLAQEQRVASEWYFRRYFHYAVPPGDISDLTVTRLVDEMVGASPAMADAALRRVLEKGAAKRFVAKLRQRASHIPPESAQPLAGTIARHGHLYPHDVAGFAFMGTHDQAAMLVSQLVLRITGMEQRQQLARDIIQEATPLPFASECLRWLHTDEKTPETDRKLAHKTEIELGQILAARIREAATKNPLYLQFSEKVPFLYWVWQESGSLEEVREHLATRFAAHPQEATTFLKTLTGKAWGMESGLPLDADLRREAYDTARRLVDPDVVLRALRLEYGAGLDTPQEHLSHDRPYGERLAHQFAWIHQAVREQEKQEKIGGSDPTDSDESEPSGQGAIKG